MSKDLSPTDKAALEQRELQRLSNDSESERIAAINMLVALDCKKAVPDLLKIAAERLEKDNRDRWMAIRALGILGDQSLVPELVPLTYHYNQNTRFWAQISLVRLTGENFGRDVAAWKTWWEKAGGKPPISDETVAWATSPDMLDWTDPKKQEEADREYDATSGQNLTAPTVVRTVPQTGDTNVDPSLTEIRVTYDKEMMNGSWAWVQTSPDTYPETTGQPRYEADGKTCVLRVKLYPGKSYVIWLNKEPYIGFHDRQGHPAVPYELRFTTRQ